MNTKSLMVGALSALLGLSACVNGDEPYVEGDVEQDPVAEAGDELLTAPFIFMHSPLLLDAGLATASFAVRAAAPLGFIAVDFGDLVDLDALDLTIGTLGPGGVITPLGLSAVTIDAALLDTIRAGIATTPLLAGVSPLAVTAPLVTALPATLQANIAALMGTTTANIAAMTAGLQLALTPSITSSALLFTGLPAITAPTTFIIGATFPIAGLTSNIINASIFTSLAVQNAAIRAALFPLPIFPGLVGATPFLL